MLALGELAERGSADALQPHRTRERRAEHEHEDREEQTDAAVGLPIFVC